MWGSFREELKSPNPEGNFYLLSQEPQTTVVHNATDGIKVSEWPPDLPASPSAGMSCWSLRVLWIFLHPKVQVFVESSLEVITGLLVTTF